MNSFFFVSLLPLLFFFFTKHENNNMIDIDVLPMISFGGTSNVTMLHQLFNTPSLTNKFIQDALVYARKYNITGYNWDLEPTTHDNVWMMEVQGFMAQFTAAMNGKILFRFFFVCFFCFFADYF